MNKILFGVVIGIIIVVGGFFWLNSYIYQEKQGSTDYKDATYIIDGKPITLVDGVAEVESAPGSESKTITRYFGNEAKGDLSGDAIPDIAFLLTQEPGGSGAFYYVVAAIQTENNTYNGTHAIFLGDRIAPQSTEWRSFSGIPGGYLVVNYADRAPGEPMTVDPSVGKSIWLKLDPATMQFGEIEQNFEGESAYAPECHEKGDYFVITRGRMNVGEDILVKPQVSGQTIPCHYVVREGDIVFTDENPTYFLDIAEHFLLLDEGTAPPPRGFHVYDLKLKKSVYNDSYNRPLEVGGSTVTYWQPIDTKVDAKNCPKLQEYTSQGLGAGIERRVVLTLSSLKVAPTGEERCSARQ